MNGIQVFNFQENKVRVIEKDGEPWLVAKDVATVLEYSSTNMPQVFAAVPNEWKGSDRIATPGGEQEMLCVSERGLYFFLARSDKPRALPFQKWIAGEVIPSARKYGAYMTPETLEKTLLNPDVLIQLAQNLKAEQEKNAQLTAKVERDAPKVLFADSVAASRTDILIGELAKLLKQNGYEIGQNRLFEQLRADGFLMKTGSSKNMPTQMAMERGLFRVNESTVNKPDGTILISKTVKVTGRGQLFFIDRFLGSRK